MPRIRCHYLDCVFLDDGFCSAAAVELDPDSGCMTQKPNDEATTGEDWEEEEELEEWDEMDLDEEEDDDTWTEDEEEDY
jgi:hypothetical protein